MTNQRILRLYEELWRRYGPQGWWPLCRLRLASGVVPQTGYHPGDYLQPVDASGCFEVAVGAILAQNTAWLNAQKAVLCLYEGGLLGAEEILAMPEAELGELIRSSGYYRQKAKKLQIWSQYFLSLESSIPSRQELLALWGIGPETADSILLYAYHQPEFVVDLYTMRLFARKGLASSTASCDAVKVLVEKAFGPDSDKFKEFHALIVAEEKSEQGRSETNKRY